MLVTQIDNNNYFVCLCDDYGGSMPHGCIAAAPPPFPWNKVWARWTGKKWEMVPDHRQRRVEEGFAPELIQEATEYWLPEDTHASPARTMTERGPLPDGALLTRPEKTQAEVEQTRQAEVQTEFIGVDAASVRALRAVLLDLTNGVTPSGEDLAMLAQDEADAIRLRAELAPPISA